MKKGAKAKVTDYDRHLHDFKIGEEVTLTEDIEDMDVNSVYTFADKNGFTQDLFPTQFEVIENPSLVEGCGDPSEAKHGKINFVEEPSYFDQIIEELGKMGPLFEITFAQGFAGEVSDPCGGVLTKFGPDRQIKYQDVLAELKKINTPKTIELNGTYTAEELKEKIEEMEQEK